MKKVLVVYAHPNYTNSRMNKALVNQIESLDSVQVSNLYQKYPTGNINIVEEQQLILESDLIVLQFPFYWFNTTPLMKEWIDKVFIDGFAYGDGGDKLHGKDLMVCITTGGSKERYDNDVMFNFPDLLKPFERTAIFCNMNYKTPFIVNDYTISDENLVKQAEKYALLLKNYNEAI